MMSTMQKINLYTLLIVLFISAVIITACNQNYVVLSNDGKIISEKSFPISPGKTLIVNVAGTDVSINRWNKPEVYIKVLGNENAKEKLDINYRNDDSSVELSIKMKHSFFNWFNGISLAVEIKVPEKFNVNVSTSGGDITLTDVSGEHQLETSGGDINCRGFTGNLKVSTSGGDVSLKGMDSQIDAGTSGGDIVLDYSGENLGINLSTSGGDIDVKLPADFNAAMEISTSGGDVSCNLNMNNIDKNTEDEIIADLNNGGNLFSASTSGGDISVRKK
ncbi:hypothetical protein BMS3Abin03_02756 [bacterium BMS3Abin03]|nr:hypothetical protein BMS3Abin03_02756 [bacterium BMS3Abin03]